MASSIYDIYSLPALIKYTKLRITSIIEGTDFSDPSENDYVIKKTMQRYLDVCHAGDPDDKLYVKNLIRSILIEPADADYAQFPKGYCISLDTIDRFIDWKRADGNPYFLFLAILYSLIKRHGENALAELIRKYRFNDLRDRNGGKSFFISEGDIRAVWKNEGVELSYDDKLEILIQIAYEENYGNSCVDEILYQNVGDISAGVSGIPGESSFKGVWIKFEGTSIYIDFLSFGSDARLKEVSKQLVDFNMRGQFSEKEGYKLGYGKDGSRRSSSIPPFGESPAFWVRKFTEKASTNEELIGNVPGAELLIAVEKALVRGGATIPICGAQGSGKTTKLESIAGYIQDFFFVRVIETEFEARLRWKYPHKNIYTVETNETSSVDASSAYNFSLRSAGDIYVIGEARSDDMIINVTRTANRGGRSVLFTFHPKTAELTIPEIANAMIREKMYSSLKDAVHTALDTVKVCIFVSVDVETHRHFYEVYEFVPLSGLIPEGFLQKGLDPEGRNLEFMRSVSAYMQAMTSAEIYFKTVPIIVYDKKKKAYVMPNTISDAFYNELLEKTPREEERKELKKIFGRKGQR